MEKKAFVMIFPFSGQEFIKEKKVLRKKKDARNHAYDQEKKSKKLRYRPKGKNMEPSYGPRKKSKF